MAYTIIRFRGCRTSPRRRRRKADVGAAIHGVLGKPSVNVLGDELIRSCCVFIYYANYITIIIYHKGEYTHYSTSSIARSSGIYQSLYLVLIYSHVIYYVLICILIYIYIYI